MQSRYTIKLIKTFHIGMINRSPNVSLDQEKGCHVDINALTLDTNILYL